MKKLISLPLIALLIFLFPSLALAPPPVTPGVQVSETDGSPTGQVWKIIFPNGQLAVAGGVGTYTGGAAAAGDVTAVFDCGSGDCGVAAGASPTVTVRAGETLTYSTTGVINASSLAGVVPSAYILTLLNDANVATAQNTLGLVIGAGGNVQAYDAELDILAATTPGTIGIALLEDVTAADARTTIDAQQLDGDLTDLSDGSLTGSKVAGVLHTATAGEIHALTNKATPIGADELVIEDSADTWNKKRIAISTITTVATSLDPDLLNGDAVDNDKVDANIINYGFGANAAETLTLEDLVEGAVGANQIPKWDGDSWIWSDDSTGGSPTFDTVGAGTNLGKALVVGEGSSLTVAGSGTINANKVGGSTVSANGISLISAADYTAMKVLLALTIGTNVQAYDADLTTYAGITPSANIQSLLAAADYAAAKVLLGLTIGTNVQAYDADLTTYAGITPSANIQSFLAAADYAAMRTLLGLVIGTNVQAYDADLTTYAGITPSTNVQSLLAAADYSAMRTALSLVPGTNVQAYHASLLDIAAVTEAAGGVVYTAGSDDWAVSAAGTATQVLQSGGAGAPVWSTFTIPGTIAAGSILAANTANQVIAVTSTDAGPLYLRNTAGTITWGAASGLGDVVGPAVATDHALPRFDTTPILLQNSGIIVDDSNNMTGVTSITIGKTATYAGSILLNEATTDEILGVGLLGPTTRDTQNLYLRFPDVDPTAGQILQFAAPATAEPDNKWVALGSWVKPILQSAGTQASLATSVTSGGLLYGSAANTISSSGALTPYGIIYSGSLAGNPPAATAAGVTGEVLSGVTSGAPTWATLLSLNTPARGGTGVANNNSSTITITGSYPLAFTLGASASVNLSNFGSGVLTYVKPSAVTYVPLGAGTIQAAIDAATAGDTLVLSAGTYTITAALTVNKWLNIVGQGRAGLISGTETDVHGTRINSVSNTNMFLITASNVRLANMSIDTSGAGINGIEVGTAGTNSYDGITLENIDLTMTTSNGAKTGINFIGSTGTVRNCILRVESANGNASGITLQNNSATTINSVVDIHTTNIVASGVSTLNTGFYVYNANDANTVTMNIFNSTATVTGASTQTIGAYTNSLTTYNSRMNIYSSTLSGTGGTSSYDIANSNVSNTNTIYGGVLINNTTNGTITYGGTIAASTFTGTITNAANIAVAAESTDTTCFPAFVTDSASANYPLKTVSSLTFNSNTGLLSATGLAGAHNGTVGATTPTTGAFTTVTGSATMASDLPLTTGQATLAASGVIFEGSTADAYEGLLSTTDIATSDKTWALPNYTGTICVAATSTTATQALFATATAGETAFRAIATADLPSALPAASTMATSLALGADPADAGVIRLPNAGYIEAEADAAGVDINIIGVDSGEIIRIGSLGASGVTVGPVAPDDNNFPLLIQGDADSDAAGDTTDALSIALTGAATPTNAVWDFTSTQSAGYRFDKSLSAGAITSSGTITSSGIYDVTGATSLTLGSADVTSWILSGMSETLTLTPSADLVTVTTGTSVAAINLSALNMVTTGTIHGKIPIVAGAGQTFDAVTDIYGTMFVATEAGTFIIPDVDSAAGTGQSFCVTAPTAIEVVVDVTSPDKIRFNGALQAAGIGITNASGEAVGDYVCLVLTDFATDVAQWTVMGYKGTWLSQ